MSGVTWKTILDINKARRSYYSLKHSSTLTDNELIEILESAIHNSPTPFNNQSTRGLLIVGEKNREMWEAVWVAHRTTLHGPEHERKAREKFEKAYLGGYGTYILFDDVDVVKAMVEQRPTLDEAFPAWVGNAAGILQYVIWTAIEAAGMGANLQHFPQLSPVTAPALSAFLNTPKNWACSAMIPFGERGADPAPRAYLPVEEKVRIIQ